MSIRVAGVEIADVRVAGVRARRVMVGTGAAAVEAWYAPAGGEYTTDLPSIVTTYATHTITDAGTYTITHRLVANSGAGGQIRARVSGPWGEEIQGSLGSPSVVTTTQTLAAGATISFRASVALGFSANATGTWSVVKQL